MTSNIYLNIESIHEYNRFSNNQYWYYGIDTTITIPFSERYPSKWMRLLLERDSDILFIVDQCKVVIPYKISFTSSDRNPYIPGVSPYNDDDQEWYDEHSCLNCQKQITTYLDYLYLEIISSIRNSIFEFILCLKYLGFAHDVKRLLGQLVWNTRKDTEWIALSNYKSDKDNTQK
jgi:hypothetical protein